jgi:hypothetical protein
MEFLEVGFYRVKDGGGRERGVIAWTGRTSDQNTTVGTHPSQRWRRDFASNGFDAPPRMIPRYVART